MEKDANRADQIADEIGSIVIAHDGCEGPYLEEAGATRADVVAAVTGDDEDNLVICQMAKHHFDVPRTIARVNNPKNEELFRHLGVDEIVSPTRMILGSIEQDIPVPELLHLATLGGGELEIIEAHLQEGSPADRPGSPRPRHPGGLLTVRRRPRRDPDTAPARHGPPPRATRSSRSAGRSARRSSTSSSSASQRRERRSATPPDPDGSPTSDRPTSAGPTLVLPTDDPARPRGDLPPSAPIPPTTAALRSLVVPGLGLLASGDRMAAAIAMATVASLTVALLAVLPYAGGTWVVVPFVIGSAVTIAWAGQAVAAWRRAAWRSERLGLAPGGGLVLLAIAPLVALSSSTFWAFAGDGASPGARTAAYLSAWWDGRAVAGAAGFVDPPEPGILGATWERQRTRLRNLAVTASAVAGPTGGIDPDRPFASVRVTELPVAAGADADRRTLRLVLVRQDVARDRVLGLAATTRRVVPVVELGTIELVRVESPHPLGLPPVARWSVVEVDLLGETIGSVPPGYAGQRG